MATKISFNLSQSSVDSAIKEIKIYEKQLITKCNVFCGKITELGMSVAKAKIGEAPLGKYVKVDVKYSPFSKGCRAVLFAIGDTKMTDYGGFNTLMAIEFGAGVKYNAVENPKADEFGMGVGTFPNQKHAFDDGGWYFLDENGEWKHSYGVKATMPMYNADIKMILNIQKIAKEIFRS